MSASPTEAVTAAAPSDVIDAAESAPDTRLRRRTWIRVSGVTLQVALILQIVREFSLENAAFQQVLFLSLVGFVIHASLPRKYRLPFFLTLSLAGIGLVLGATHTVLLLGIGLALIGICHLPLPLGARVTMLVLAGVSVALVRGGALSAPVSGAVWTVLGSIFMFRLIIYIYDIRYEKERQTASSTLSYFFMLPNVVFPLFPVIDYRTFRRTYYDEDAVGIYETGARWMAWGCLHLILYRIVYYHFALGPAEVTSGGDLLQFLVTNYLLYLRVSGQFHLIVGILHLFGFNLPRTNYLYYLASSFNDIWRRMNIYWKDFAMKIFYFPLFFGLKKLGQTAALVLATLLVFVITMLLHSYQWFWLRGDFVLSTQDALFWGTLAAVVTANSLYEKRKGRKRRFGRQSVSLGEISRRALATVAVFTGMCVLWSLWSASSPSEWLSLWTVLVQEPGFDPESALLLAGGLGLLVSVTYWQHVVGRRDELGSPLARLWRSPVFVTGVLVTLYVGAHPRVQSLYGWRVASAIQSVQQQRLNRQDLARLERGYYQNLLGGFNPELANIYSKKPADWRAIWQTDAVRWTGDALRMELAPLARLQDFKGAPLTVNRFGLRDRDYEMRKGEGVYRLAVLGASLAMGSGVADDQTFEALVEDRLNRELGGETRYEILNFAVPSYTYLQNLIRLESKALAFQPDIVLLINHETEGDRLVNDVVGLLEDGIEIPYPGLVQLLRGASVDYGTSPIVASRRLAAVKYDLLGWIYARIRTLCRERGITPVWVFIPNPAEGIRGPANRRTGEDPRRPELLRLARAAGFPILDLVDAYEGVAPESLWVAEWDRHPNARGHRLVADGLFDALLANADALSLPLSARTRSVVDAKDSRTEDKAWTRSPSR